MKGRILTILSLTAAILLLSGAQAQDNIETVRVEFCGNELAFTVNTASPSRSYNLLEPQELLSFYDQKLSNRFEAAIQKLTEYRQSHKPDDWLYYQLIRRTAQHVSPKESDYLSYTLHKWHLLTRSGYDAILTVSADKMLFYARCDENIYNIPTRIENGKQYVCLNYHDYGSIDFKTENFRKVDLPAPDNGKIFSYKVTSIPDFQATEYLEKDLHFSYNENDFHFRVKMSPQVQKLFTNYPVVDFESFMNIPLSPQTYNSLIPQLKKVLKGMHVKHGVDYLMRFTRYAFLFEADTKLFGSEKRLSPEQTLFYDQSDCEDRVALFFYLVKEIYDLPMIVLAFPTHVTIAVEFDRPVGTYVTYKGRRYSICEPTPQKQDLGLGQLLPELAKTRFQIAYAYQPSK